MTERGEAGEREFDFIVAGGGMAGVCAALAAARHGLRVALVEQSARLGGDSNSLRRRPIVGSDVWGTRPHGRETGLLEELRLTYFAEHPEPRWEAWDEFLESALRRQPTLSLFLNTTLRRADRAGDGSLAAVTGDSEGRELRLAAPLFADCTGSAALGRMAGADLHEDAEPLDTYAEPLCDQRIAPPGARLIGDVTLTEGHLRDAAAFDDEVAYGGWPLSADYGWNEESRAAHPDLWLPSLYPIPLRCLYSRNVPNLLMAGSNASASAVARLSTGVMGTAAVMGQAIGTCAAVCRKRDATPRAVAEQHLWELQQTLLKDDAALVNRLSEDPGDLARFSRAVATSKLTDETIPSNVINGVTRATDDWPQLWASAPKIGFPTNIELDFVERRVVDTIHLTFDTGLSRALTLTDDPERQATMVLGPQPETVKRYTVLAGLTTRWNPLVEVDDNVQRKRIHHFAPVRVNRLRVMIHETHGADHARIYEIRCCAEGLPPD